MKEFELTPRPQNPYSKGGDIFMDSGQNEQPPIEDQSFTAKASENPRLKQESPVSSKRIEETREAWEKVNKDKIVSIDEKRVQEMAIEKGWFPMVGAAEKKDKEEKKIQSRSAREEEWEEALEEIEKYKPEKNPEERKKAIMEFLKILSPHTNSVPPEIIGYIIEYDETLDYFVNRIIAQPLDAETSDYRLSFYGGINLEQIKDVLRTKSQTETAKKNQYQRILLISEATSLFHTMNMQIVTGSMGNFVKGSQGITPEQMQIMQNVSGVAQIMRAFDEEFNRVSSLDSYINQKNYDKMLGIEKDPDGRIKGKEVGTIENYVRKLIEAKVPSMNEVNNLENWQIDWAFHAGKILFNITLKAAEIISQGKVPTGDEQYASIPQESAARLMNWMAWTGLRFTISQERGGVQLVEMASENFQISREEEGYKKISLEKIAGKDVKDYELSGLLGARGIFNSWRQNLIILEHAPMVINGQKTTIRRYMQEERKNHTRRITEELKNKGLTGNKLNLETKKRLRELEPQILRDIFLSNGELKKEFNNALGVLLKIGAITSSSVDLYANGLVDAKEDIRAAIWRRIAQENPLGIAPLLHGAKYHGGEDILLTDETALTEEGKRILWNELTVKLMILNEIRLQKIINGESTSLDQLIEEESQRAGGIRLTPEERTLLEKIQTEGTKIAKEFANIRFPFTPTMTDVIYEKVNYGEAGAEFYRRGAGGDVEQFHTAGNSFGKLMDNPGGMPIDEALKVWAEVTEAIGSVLGMGTGQDKVKHGFKAYLEFIEKGGQIKGRLKGLRKWLAKSGAYSWVLEMLRKPNSVAQQFSGTDAPAIDEFDLDPVFKKSLVMGILRKGKKNEDGSIAQTDLDSWFRKKFKVNKLGFLLAILRDIFPLFVAAAFIDLGQRSVREK